MSDGRNKKEKIWSQLDKMKKKILMPDERNEKKIDARWKKWKKKIWCQIDEMKKNVIKDRQNEKKYKIDARWTKWKKNYMPDGWNEKKKLMQNGRNEKKIWCKKWKKFDVRLTK